MENIDIFLCWIVLSFFINLLGLGIDIKIPYYRGKWVKDKKTPIYKLEYKGNKKLYSVYKWELKWEELVTDCEGIVIFGLFFIPTFTWFNFPKYERTGESFGLFTQEKLEELGLFNLEEYYNKQLKDDCDIHNALIIKENMKKNKIEKYNEEFRKHFGE
jgi:hypothetical protein